MGFLAVKAGFSLSEATTLAFASQYVDHHDRTYEISTPQGLVRSSPTQNYSFWDPDTVTEVLAPFHFLPAGPAAREFSPRRDGAHHPWDVRPNSEPAKRLLVSALKTRDLCRIGIALHTFADTWAHQNFTARNEVWNRLDSSNPLPSPGHAHAGRSPDSWQESWVDPRLIEPQVVNELRFQDAARKIYRYLCVFRGKEFRDEDAVGAELTSLMAASRYRETSEERMLDFIVSLGMEPYRADLWRDQALEVEPGPDAPRWKKVGDAVLQKFGMGEPCQARAKVNFETSLFAGWLRAAEAHRGLAKALVAEAISS